MVAAGLVGLLLVKGILVVMGFGACALWLLVCRGRGLPGDPPPRLLAGWGALAAAGAAVLAAAFAYEQLYLQATGESFWGYYLGDSWGRRRRPVRGGPGPEGATTSSRTWAVCSGSRSPGASSSWRRSWARGALCETRSSPDGRLSPDALAGLLFTLTLTALYLGLFSLSDRRADRYIFPVYFVVAACGAVVALGLFSPLRRLAERLNRQAGRRPGVAFPPALRPPYRGGPAPPAHRQALAAGFVGEAPTETPGTLSVSNE